MHIFLIDKCSQVEILKLQKLTKINRDNDTTVTKLIINKINNVLGIYSSIEIVSESSQTEYSRQLLQHQLTKTNKTCSHVIHLTYK